MRAPKSNNRSSHSRQGVQLVKEGASGTERGRRFAQYVIPKTIVGDEVDRAIYIPKFNERISPKALLWPQARAKWDDQRVCLVSVETAGGWRHDLWFPGYLWADIENRWTVPGMNYRDGMESYDLANPDFDRAIQQLNDAERGEGRWTIGTGAFMFHSQIQSQYPVVVQVSTRAEPPSLATWIPILLARFCSRRSQIHNVSHCGCRRLGIMYGNHVRETHVVRVPMGQPLRFQHSTDRWHDYFESIPMILHVDMDAFTLRSRSGMILDWSANRSS